MKPPRFWIMQDHHLKGPYDMETLSQMPGFTLTTLLCREGEDVWQPAAQAFQIRVRQPAWSERMAPTTTPVKERQLFSTDPVIPFEKIEIKTMPAPESVSYLSGDFSPREPRLAYAAPSARVWTLFLCLSIVNSLYWASGYRSTPIVFTLPIPVGYIPPASPERHTIKKAPEPTAENNKKPPFQKKGGRHKTKR